MKKKRFSVAVPKEPPKTQLGKFIHWLLHADDDRCINYSFVANSDDINNVLSDISEIKTFCAENSWFQNGIQYIVYTIQISDEALKNSSAGKVADAILTTWRRYWQQTRNLNPAPFCEKLTASTLVLGVPVSKQGYRVVADMQEAQQLAIRKQHATKKAKEEKADRLLKDRHKR